MIRKEGEVIVAMIADTSLGLVTILLIKFIKITRVICNLRVAAIKDINIFTDNNKEELLKSS
jgi:hypothetical protein